MTPQQQRLLIQLLAMPHYAPMSDADAATVAAAGMGIPIVASDVTMARKIIAALASMVSVVAMINAANSRVQALRQSYAAAIAANPATAVAPTLAQLATAFGDNS